MNDPFSVIRIHLFFSSIFRRCPPIIFLKCFAKIIHIFKSRLAGNYSYLFLRRGQKLCSLLLMALLAVFILDTLIAHRIYKSRAGKYGDVLTVFTVLSLGLLRPVFLFAVRNRAAESVPAPECGN